MKRVLISVSIAGMILLTFWLGGVDFDRRSPDLGCAAFVAFAAAVISYLIQAAIDEN
jgi:hypothetical protein